MNAVHDEISPREAYQELAKVRRAIQDLHDTVDLVINYLVEDAYYYASIQANLDDLRAALSNAWGLADNTVQDLVDYMERGKA
ncbi:MAG: hypothetical protein QXJ23_10205 [Thermofilum sp.]|uniref:hypothetical protein n=1 Tax=Thermofilum sp. TaxID=1961369 RepID=UPI00317DEB03